MKKVFASFALVTASIALVACGGGSAGSGSDNPGAGMSVALVAYSQALTDYLNAAPGTTVNEGYVESTGGKLRLLRDRFSQVESEASGIVFPTVFEKKGQPAQSTVQEYLSATGAYIALEEELFMQIESCIASGSSVTDCLMTVGESAMLGIYPDVMKRAQAAALQLRQETSTRP